MSLFKTFEFIKNHDVKLWVLWLIFFSYTSLMAVSLQLVVLPYILPKANLGEGIFVPDSSGFHKIASGKAQEMSKEGWKAWEMKPNGCYPAGIASVFYYLWKPKPYSMIPFNAAMHAFAGCLVFLLLRTFIHQPVIAMCGALIFVANPASLEWTAQIHKDGTFILGNLMILYGWVVLVTAAGLHKRLNYLYALLLSCSGSMLIWISRPYWIQVSNAVCTLMFVILLITWGFVYGRKLFFDYYRVAALLLAILMIITAPPVKIWCQESHEDNIKGSLGYSPAIKDGGPHKRPDRWHSKKLVPDDGLGAEIKAFPTPLEWHKTPFSPEAIENKFYAVWSFRKGTITAGGKTIIDKDVELNSIGRFVKYIPRALQIGFFSPFPTELGKAGSSAAHERGKTVMVLFTMFFCLCIFFFLWSIWKYRKNLEYWLVVFFCTCGLLVYTYVYANVGTLARLRYGFYMVFVAIGFALIIEQLAGYISKKLNHT